MNMTAVTITAIICVTVAFIFWMAYQDNNKKGDKNK